MLAGVKRPDGRTIKFGYDALGRRVSKTVDGTVRRFGWDGNVVLHEWDISEADRPKLVPDAIGREEYDGPEHPEHLVTWIYDGTSFTPVAKVAGGERYTIVQDYLGTPTQAYDSRGELVWEMLLDVYENAKEYTGEKCFIPFRYPGQYEDEVTGLYYNRFRYYSPQMGMYISSDPIGLEGNNPTLYGYVLDVNTELDIIGLFVGINFFSELKPSGMGHHPIPRGHANQHGLPKLGTPHDSPSWYPYDTKDSNILHYNMHKALDENGVPFSGKFNGTQAELIQKIKNAYSPFMQKGYVKIQSTGKIIAENVTVAEAVDIQLEWNNKMTTCKN